MGVATSWFFFKFHWFGSNDRQYNDTLRVLFSYDDRKKNPIEFCLRNSQELLLSLYNG